MKYSKQTITITSIVILVAVGAFFGGTVYGKHHASSMSRAAFTGMNAQRGQFGQGSTGARSGAMFGGAVSGTILSKDETSITVKLSTGGSRIVLFGASTPIMKSTAATLADLKVGDTVFASGAPNADGSITAQSISLGTMPFMRADMGGIRPTTPNQ